MDLILKLSVQDVQYIIRALNRQPHEDVDGLLKEILRQANAQLPAKSTPEAPKAEASAA